ncbi:MAG: EAL domain-containing protein [Actinomycetales bacterium]
MTDTVTGHSFARSLLQATLEATADGILVIDLNGQVKGSNTRFHRIWRVPTELHENEDGEAMLRHMCSVVTDPGDLLAQVAELTADADRVGSGEVHLLDGRVVERFSLPQRLDGQVIGRVWSFRDVTSERGLREDLERMAYRDAVTGIANRARFLADLEARLGRDDPRLAVVILDLDGFKYVNDGYGHRYGDIVLCTVANRLVGIAPPGATVARLGGDEFGLLLPVADPGEVERICLSAARALDAPMALGMGLTAQVGASVGWTIQVPGTAVDADQLLHEADLAMYQAKQSGRCLVRGYAEHMRRSDPLNTWTDVRELLSEPDSLDVVFQPIHELQTGRLWAHEALSRFPGRTARTVADWFSAARTVGLGDELEARAVALILERALARPQNTRLCLNLTPASLMATKVRTALDRDLTGVVIELTEQPLFGIDELVNATRWLADRGAELAIDDAGEGYSGLRRIVLLRPHLVKLDRNLVTQVDQAPEKAALVEAMVSFCQRTDTRLCAEGIETTDELRMLSHLGVELGQGFLLARPNAQFAAPARAPATDPAPAPLTTSSSRELLP